MSTLLLNNDNNKSFAIPEGLKARCIRIFGWDNDFADRAFMAYQQFMKLKLQQEDWDATVLSPSGIVDQVWHQHILDVKHYVKACEDYTGGHLIGHNPDGGLDIAARADRFKSTKLCLRTLFGRNVDREIWSFGGGERGNNKKNDDDDDGNKENLSQNDNDNDSSPKQKKRRVGDSTTTAATTTTNTTITISEEDPEEEKITLGVRDWQTGEEIMFIIKRNQSMGRIFENYATRKGMSVDRFRFVFRGKEIHPSQTPKELEINQNDQIYVLVSMPSNPHNDDKPITIHLRNQTGEVIYFKVKRGTRMQKIFDTYAQRFELKAYDLHFLLEGERIDPTHTPHTLELDDQDEIYVMRAQTGC